MITNNQIQAIYKLYPQVKSTIDDIAYDVNGNKVTYNLSAVTTQAQKDVCKAQAKALLAASDWSVLPDVGLANADDFVIYRGILRGYATQPVANPDFPVEPTPIWS